MTLKSTPFLNETYTQKKWTEKQNQQARTLHAFFTEAQEKGEFPCFDAEDQELNYAYHYDICDQAKFIFRESKWFLE